MKIKIDVNLELGLQEYDQRQPEITTPENIPALTGLSWPGERESLQSGAVRKPERTVH